MFAEDYPRFMEVSELIPKPQRMNERYEALFASNRDIFDGARVLDLCQPRRTIFVRGAEDRGAHVTGLEVRESLVQKARGDVCPSMARARRPTASSAAMSFRCWPVKSSTSTWCYARYLYTPYGTRN